MRELLRAAFVIARRDYVASVFSKTFLFFLIAPLLPVVVGGLFGSMGADIDRKATHPTVAVIADAADGALIAAARARLATRMGSQALPDLSLIRPSGDVAVQTRRLLTDTGESVVAVISGPIGAPVLSGPKAAINMTQFDMALIYDGARTEQALGLAGAAVPAPVKLRAIMVDQAAGNDRSARMLTARLAQMVMMFLVMILAGMLLSNLIEEKSNKVIEVLAAAVPVDGIFIGKLLAMLAKSLTGILVWGTAAVAAVTILYPGVASNIPAPAIGWPVFVALGVIYFVACFLLLGSVFLGIGAQAPTVREVQTLSMPVTMAQLGVVAFASTVVGAPDSNVAMGAMIFPWSSPFAMLARASERPEIWPHLIAIAWQALWIVLIIRVSARIFRASVLKSGKPMRWRFWRRAPKASGGSSATA